MKDLTCIFRLSCPHLLPQQTNLPHFCSCTSRYTESSSGETRREWRDPRNWAPWSDWARNSAWRFCRLRPGPKEGSKNKRVGPKWQGIMQDYLDVNRNQILYQRFCHNFLLHVLLENGLWVRVWMLNEGLPLLAFYFIVVVEDWVIYWNILQLVQTPSREEKWFMFGLLFLCCYEQRHVSYKLSNYL